MDSTPDPNPNKPQPDFTFHSPLSIKSKLPIKRKTLTSSNSNPKPNTPSKFHRVWTEADEILFLQGLLESSKQNLSFPKDLHIFFTQFSLYSSQSYTKSQLSEKLRRLRKKFRATSSRLARGLDPLSLSDHDRALFDLSEKLWSPKYASLSPFGNYSSGNELENYVGLGKRKDFDSDLINVDVGFSAELDFGVIDNDVVDDDRNVGCNSGAEEGEVSEKQCGVLGLSRDLVAKTALDVLDQCSNETRMKFSRMGLVYQECDGCTGGFSLIGNSRVNGFKRRWHEQVLAELDVFIGRLRLVLEESFNHA